MGFVLIRHSAVEHRKVNKDRVPKVLCVLEREFVLVVSVRCGME